jgi:ribonuclease P protein component
MVVRFVPNALGFDRYAISTSRRVGGAVTRNRVRRRIREVLRASTETGHGWDILVIVRPSGADATFDEVRASLRRLLSRIRESEPARVSAKS